jgi:CheY-like chemotaxis protein
MSREQSVNIVMIEDDEGHARLIERNIRRAGIRNEVHHFVDGTSALKFLFEDPRGPAVNGPALVLLDLNLPRRGGLEVLADLKADPDLRAIPVVVLTTSQAEADIARSYELHANAYVIKPIDAAKFADAIKQIDEFFLILMRQPQYAPRLS